MHSSPSPRHTATSFDPRHRPTDPLRLAIDAATRRPETECVPPLVAAATLPPDMAARVKSLARRLTENLRAGGPDRGVRGIIQEYSLSSEEGVALMCLAEALLRIPDTATRDALIRDKMSTRRLARPSRPRALALRQCRDLGPGGHRQADRHRRLRRGSRGASAA